MPGKWSGLKTALPKAPIEEGFQSSVNLQKQEYIDKGLTRADQGREFCLLREKKDTHEEEIRKINVKLEALSQLLIPALESDGMDMFRLETGESLSIKDEPYASVENKPMFLNWIKSSGLEDLLTVHYQTMSAMVKERLQKGMQVPPGLKVFIKQSIVRRKGRQHAD